MKTILYICPNGIREALVASQVLAYMREMEHAHRFILVTVERQRPVARPDLPAHIQWVPLVLPGGFRGARAAGGLLRRVGPLVWLARRQRVSVVHARGLHGASLGWPVARAVRRPLLFDARGLWAEERVADGRLVPRSAGHRLATRVESRLVRRADEVVVLTEALREAFVERGRPANQITVIPTCVDLDRFSVGDPPPVPYVDLLHVGSLGGRYDIASMASFVAVWLARHSAARFRVLTKSATAPLVGALAAAGMADAALRIEAADSQDVPRHIEGAAAGLCLLRPSAANKASCPTKIAELLASGIPVVLRRGVGDFDTLLPETRTGVLIADPSSEGLRAAASALEALLADPETPRRCRRLAAAHFDLRAGAARYAEAYERMLERRRDAR